MELLKRGWPAGEEARYDADAVLVLCRMRDFRDGLLFLYERMRLYREVLQVQHIARNSDSRTWYGRLDCPEPTDVLAWPSASVGCPAVDLRHHAMSTLCLQKLFTWPCAICSLLYIGPQDGDERRGA